MNKFRIDFITSLEKLKLQKTFVASKLDMTMPTLNSKVLNPEKLTLKDLSKLLELGFQIDIINILKEIKENMVIIIKSLREFGEVSKMNLITLI